MKSHSYIPTTSTRGLAQKINRSGVSRMHPEEIEHLEKNLELIAASCQPERAKELFSFFNRSMPEGFECNPVAGENDAEMARIRARFDERRRG